LSWAFNSMVEMLEELSSATERVAACNLTVTLERPGQLQDAFRAMLAQLNLTVGRMRETSVQLATAAAEITALAQAQEQAAQQQAVGIEEIGGTVASLSNAARDISIKAREVLGDAERTRTMTVEMGEQIGTLRRHAASVADLLAVVHEIADRSDLLALNGSLEAVRAGEAGRGFALVAGEMRRLAERVTGIVDDVRGRLDDIERSGAGAVETTVRSSELSQRTTEAARGIATLTERQESDTEAAASRVIDVVAVVVDGTRALSQLRDAAEGLREYAADLELQIAAFEVDKNIDS
ncbi:MAG: methyl-accepting chemotaxis protein, partial [Myxococcales bacterium]|nr:methyl-accepting chemotaxis protein [Myxococcales bacterium]